VISHCIRAKHFSIARRKKFLNLHIVPMDIPPFLLANSFYGMKVSEKLRMRNDDSDQIGKSGHNGETSKIRFSIA
jgi:hypothetical protein